MSPRIPEITPAQRRYLDAFDRLLFARDRESYAQARRELTNRFHSLFTERDLPEPSRADPVTHDDESLDRLFNIVLAPPVG